MIKLVIYDLDGTLIDSSKDISDSVNWALKQLGLGKLSENVIRSYVGSGVRNLLRGALAELGKPENEQFLNKAVSLYKIRYADHLLDSTKLYPGVPNVLEYFSNKKQAVITNKPKLFSEQILKGFGIDRYFFEIIGGDDYFPKKPSPDSVLELIRKSQIKPDETILIGDSEIDIQTAKNAKIKMIAVTYGFSSRKELASQQPDFLIGQLDEMMNLKFFL